MVYSYVIDTPASTAKDTPLVTALPISKGVIRHWFILFPEGNWCEAPITIKKGGDAIIPFNPSEGLRGNGMPFTSEEFIFIKTPPWELQAYTWNEDGQNDHKIYITITVMPLWTLLPYSNALLDLLEQEEVKVLL